MFTPDKSLVRANRELTDQNGLGVLGLVRMELITWREQKRKLTDWNELGVSQVILGSP